MLMLMEEGYYRKKYYPIFKLPPKVVLKERDKEKLVKTFFYNLRNNGGSIPTRFLSLYENKIIQFTFENCRARLDREILIVKPVYSSQIL